MQYKFRLGASSHSHCNSKLSRVEPPRLRKTDENSLPLVIVPPEFSVVGQAHRLNLCFTASQPNTHLSPGQNHLKETLSKGPSSEEHSFFPRELSSAGMGHWDFGGQIKIFLHWGGGVLAKHAGGGGGGAQILCFFFTLQLHNPVLV